MASAVSSACQDQSGGLLEVMEFFCPYPSNAPACPRQDAPACQLACSARRPSIITWRNIWRKRLWIPPPPELDLPPIQYGPSPHPNHLPFPQHKSYLCHLMGCSVSTVVHASPLMLFIHRVSHHDFMAHLPVVGPSCSHKTANQHYVLIFFSIFTQRVKVLARSGS